MNVKTLICEHQYRPAKAFAVVVFSSLFLGLLGHLSIRLPFTPVPLVLQNSACLFLGALLGPRLGAASVALFLAQAAFGLPVLAGGSGGIAKFFGPTGGYLVGYLAGTYLVGMILERVEKTRMNVFWALMAGSGVQFFLGALHLSLFIGGSQALLLGVFPFILGDVFKSLGLATLLKMVRHTKRS